MNNNTEVSNSVTGTDQLKKDPAKLRRGDSLRVIKKMLWEISLLVAVYTNRRMKTAEMISVVLANVDGFMSKCCYTKFFHYPI
jgi:hypothetical protein